MNIDSVDHRVPGAGGVAFLLRNLRAARRASGSVPVLFVHGATYPSTVMFDYPVDGTSWMAWMAEAGFDVWCIDLPGYGGADRPAVMAANPAAGEPFMDTRAAAAEVRRAVTFIVQRSGAAGLDLLGYSWGSAICAQVAGEIPDIVRRLVLAGPLWLMDGASSAVPLGALGAYRRVDAEAIVRRWTMGLNAQQQAAIAPPERLQRWARAAVASDPDAAMLDPPQLRAPAGVIKDVRDYWLAGRSTYDPARVRCPILVVVGEWDQETTPAQGAALFAALTGSAQRRYTVIGGGTHALLLENQRHELYAVVRDFLCADGRAAG